MYSNFKVLTFILFIIFISCNGNLNTVILSSLDNTQTYNFEIGKIQCFYNSKLDSLELLHRIKNYEFYKSKLKDLIISADSNNIIFLAEKRLQGFEGELFFFFIGTIIDKKIEKVYFVEIGEHPFYWENVEEIFIINMDDKYIVDINGKFKSVGWAVSEAIRFSYNEKGLWDYNITRYINIKARFYLEINNHKT